MIQDAWGWCTGMTHRDGMGRELTHLVHFVPGTYKVKERPISHVGLFMKTEEVPVMPLLLLPRLDLVGMFVSRFRFSFFLGRITL